MQYISVENGMDKQDFLKLMCVSDYYAQVNVCVQQSWQSYKTFSCINAPKENDLLVFINRAKVTYSMKDGETFSLKNGDIAYVPSGKEYTFTVNERDEDYGCTYGINFLLFDDLHQRVFLENNQIIPDANHLREYFHKMSEISESGTHSYAELHSIFYKIISSLSEGEKHNNIKNFPAIKKGIDYLENDTSLSLSVLEIAKMCNVSQNYFCRLFKAYSGMTPQEYILNTKIEKAKVLLNETSLSVYEVSLQCGFQDSSYFCRLFKKKTGVSPKTFKKTKKLPM